MARALQHEGTVARAVQRARLSPVLHCGLLFLAHLLAPPLAARAGPDSITPWQLTLFQRELQRDSLFFRAPVNQSKAVYLTTPAGLAAYEFRSLNIFRLRGPEPVSLQFIRGTPFRVDASFRSRRYGNLRVAFYPPPGNLLDSLTLHALIQEAIAPSRSSFDLEQIYGNRLSRLAHARGCNHLPDPVERESFLTLDDATKAGYAACPLCFTRTPLIPEYALERSLGDMASAQLLAYYPLVVDQSLQQRVEGVGRRVLTRWPFPLRGYDYSFAVIDCPTPNAFACAAGRIYVTSALMGIVEREAELEAALAHEITHVERRHTLQELKLRTKGAMWGAFLSILFGVAVQATSDDPNSGLLAARVVETLSAFAIEAAAAGHSVTNEEEADSYALLYLRNQAYPDSTLGFSLGMAKLQYSETMSGLAGAVPGLLATHPYIADRIAKAAGTSVRLFPAGTSFRGVDKDGESVGTLTLNVLSRSSYQPAPPPGTVLTPAPTTAIRLYATFESGPEVRFGTKIVNLTVTTPAGDVVLDNYEDTQVFPETQTALSFHIRADRSFSVEDVLAIRCVVPGITRWIRTE